MHFLLDSEADVSLFPVTKKDNITMDFKLKAVNGTEILIYGIKILILNLGL